MPSPKKIKLGTYLTPSLSEVDLQGAYLKPSLSETDMEIELQDLGNTLAVGSYFTGKKTWLQNLALQIIEGNSSVFVIDTENYFDQEWVQRLSTENLSKISFLDFAQEKAPGINLFQDLQGQNELESFVIEKFFCIIDYLYDLKKTGGPMFENYFKNALRLLLSHSDSGTNLGLLPKILVDKDYRAFKLAMCEDPQVVDFWEKEATKAGGEASLENMVPYITSKLSPFVNDNFVKKVVLQEKTTVNFDSLINGSTSLIIKLDPLKLTKRAISILGIILLTKLQLEFQKKGNFNSNVILPNLQPVLNDSFLDMFEFSKRNPELKIFCGLDYLNQLKINQNDYREFFENSFINQVNFYNKSDSSTHTLKPNQAVFDLNLKNQKNQKIILNISNLPEVKNNIKLSDLIGKQEGMSIEEVDKEMEKFEILEPKFWSLKIKPPQ